MTLVQPETAARQHVATHKQLCQTRRSTQNDKERLQWGYAESEVAEQIVTEELTSSV
jgi:hypothetical protein